MSHCQCDGIERCFNVQRITKELARYRQRGPAKNTRLLVEALLAELQAQGIEGRTLLDIGGGIGAIPHLLLEDGMRQAMVVEASAAYLAGGRAAGAGEADLISARRLGHACAEHSRRRHRDARSRDLLLRRHACAGRVVGGASGAPLRRDLSARCLVDAPVHPGAERRPADQAPADPLLRLSHRGGGRDDSRPWARAAILPHGRSVASGRLCPSPSPLNGRLDTPADAHAARRGHAMAC